MPFYQTTPRRLEAEREAHREAERQAQDIGRARPTLTKAKVYGPRPFSDLADDQCRYQIQNAPRLFCGRKVFRGTCYCQHHAKVIADHRATRTWRDELEEDMRRFEEQDEPIPGVSSAITGWERDR